MKKPKQLSKTAAAVDQVVRGKMTAGEAARHFEVSESAVYTALRVAERRSSGCCPTCGQSLPK